MPARLVKGNVRVSVEVAVYVNVNIHQRTAERHSRMVLTPSYRPSEAVGVS